MKNLKNNFFSQNFLSFILWLIYFFVIVFIICFSQHPRTVTPNYYHAALHWIAGENLYDGTGTGFIYLPQAAILYIPLALLPFKLSEILWRLIAFLLLILSSYHFFALPWKIKSRELFFTFTLIAIPLGFDSLRNGQFNIVLIAMMLLTCVSLHQNKPWLSSFYLVLGFAFKPTMIVFLLLIWPLFYRLYGRLLVVFIVFLLLPFATQHIHYVLNQYSAAKQSLLVSFHLGENSTEWSQFFSMIAQMGFGWINSQTQFFVRLAMALFVFILGIKARFKLSEPKIFLWLYSFASCYLLLWNPRTENNDYIILAPVLSYFLIVSWKYKAYFAHILLILTCFAITFSYNLSHFFFPPFKSIFAPLTTTLFFASILLVFFSKKMNKEIA